MSTVQYPATADGAIKSHRGSLRPMDLVGKCQTYQGHQHDEDHYTHVLIGRVRIEQMHALGQEPFETSEHDADGPRVLIKAEVFHRIKAMTDYVLYVCVFEDRAEMYDQNGQVA